jgi:hypothetical protein
MMNVVPRVFYPTKPPTAGEIYTRYFHDRVWRTGVTYLGMPWVGELYMNGGPAGVVLGMMATGLIFAWLYTRFALRVGRDSCFWYAVAMFALYFLIVRGSLQAFSYPALWFGLGWLGLRLATKAHRRSDPGGSRRSDSRRTHIGYTYFPVT